MKKKKKKDAEKIKLKGAKPTKKLKRIQPNKIERKAMVCFKPRLDITAGHPLWMSVLSV